MEGLGRGEIWGHISPSPLGIFDGAGLATMAWEAIAIDRPKA